MDTNNDFYKHVKLIKYFIFLYNFNSINSKIENFIFII